LRPTPKHVVLAISACSAYIICMQYTLRNIPPAVDRTLRRRAGEEGKSLNETAVEALCRGLGVAEESVRYRDLSDLAGTWIDDPEFEAALADQHRIDRGLWE